MPTAHVLGKELSNIPINCNKSATDEEGATCPSPRAAATSKLLLVHVASGAGVDSIRLNPLHFNTLLVILYSVCTPYLRCNSTQPTCQQAMGRRGSMSTREQAIVSLPFAYTESLSNFLLRHLRSTTKLKLQCPLASTLKPLFDSFTRGASS